MLIPLIVSYFVWLFILIRLTRLETLKWRFWIKAVTCAHFVVLAAWAIIRFGIHDNDQLLLQGLVLSFFGDLALGLKHRSKWMMAVGILFFMSAMGSYTVFYGISVVSLWLSIPVLMGLGLISINISQSKFYDFKGAKPMVLLYGFLLSFMAVTALSKGLLEPSTAALIRTIGSLMLLVSDMILLHVYFYIIKKPNQIPLYLVLYHLGQGLIAFSLWVI